MRRYSFAADPNVNIVGFPRAVLVHPLRYIQKSKTQRSCLKSIFPDLAMESLKNSTNPASAKTEGYSLSPINESPTSIEGHGTVTGDQPIDPPSTEGHRGTFA